ncbi:MAG: hypothetical protein JJU00_04210 [Opitutales bacterium]|nr:hypothetical protein [Opitutales bacterium]
MVLAAMLAAPVLSAQNQLAGVCARVKIEIEQELTIERIGFDATLEVTNNDADDPLTDFAASLVFLDPQEPENSPNRDVSDRFFVQPPVLENINRVDGNGVIGPTRRAVVRWFIIPKPDAGGTDPNGKVYFVKPRLAASIRGDAVPAEALFAVPETITVYPEPRLQIRYFQPRDVQANDPFTPEIEAPVPFTLGVLVTNSGFALARNVVIRSQQPRIVENLQGLLLVARLLGARVMDSPLNEASLTVDLGDIPPGGTRKGAWDMITTLSGEFVDFRARYTHASELGGEETSLIELIEAHFIAAEVLNDEPGRDRVLDFLADTDRDPDRIPDTLFESDGTILPVNHLQQVTVNPFTAPRTFTVDLSSDFEGWGYMRMDDPGRGNLKIESVVRSDGRVINEHNAWTSVRAAPGDPVRIEYLHIFDRVEAATDYTYTVTFAAPVDDTTPPVTRLRFSGEVTQVDGAFHVTRETQMFFTVEDDSPTNTVYRLDDGDFRPFLPFTLRDPGVYTMEYFSVDTAGNEEAVRTATLILPEGGPAVAGVDIGQETLFLAGSALSVRPREAALTLAVAANPLPVDAVLGIYRGVRVHPVVRGLPVSPTPRADLDLTVEGELVDFYRYRLNEGAWSAERAVDEPLPVRGTDGEVVLEILGRSAVGDYPANDEALRFEWEVDPEATDWQVAGLPPHATTADSVEAVVEGTGFDLFRWTFDDGFFRPEAPPGSPVSLSGLAAGPHTLAFITPTGEDEWPIDGPAAVYRWTVDPAHGSDLAGLPLVVQRSFSAVQGSTVDIAWDGRDDSGALLAPGWYTVLLKLEDPIGNITHTKQLFRIEQLTGEGVVMSGAAAGPRRTDARGAWLVWEESGAGAPNVRARRVDGGSAAFAVTASARAQEHPRTDGRYVVWQGRGENGNWDVFLADLESPSVIERLTQTPGMNETRPVIDWPWVAWQERPLDGSSPWQVRATNLKTEESFLVFPGPDEQLTPHVDAGRIVWRDMRHPGTGEIYFQDLEDGTTRRLTENLFAKVRPRIDGPWVVWQDNRMGQVEIFGYNLLRGFDEQLTSGPGNKSNPSLADGWLLYEEDSLFVNSVNFEIMDLATRRSVPLTRSDSPKSGGVVVADRFAWLQTDGEAGAALREARLPALQAVFDNQNAVPVTEGMAAAYGNAFSLLADWGAAAGVASVSRFAGSVPDWTEETAVLDGGFPAGNNFPLEPGAFLWIRFAGDEVLELDVPPTAAINLPAGISALSYDRFPLGYSAAAFIRDLGPERVRAIRFLDSATGFWRSLEVKEDGELLGPNFRIPAVAVVLVDLREAIPSWTPYTP